MRVPAIDGVFHDPAAAVVVDGVLVAAEEERAAEIARTVPRPGSIRRPR
jgi:hypothetical protein